MSSGKLSNFALAGAVFSIVAMLVIPVPDWLLDLLLVVNISFSLCLIFSAVYTTSVERFTSLPNILLIFTLFRLSLNVSTTRLILSRGEAPQIVSAFGELLVGGNLLVGIVIFLIVSIIQFVVIAKGAERVAEVSARFTLDALPGKQMSIDADVRAGLLSFAEAKKKRFDLQRESRLFGALDGAMKFVKGDAIAGLLIAVVNLVAGVLRGVLYDGLDIVESLSVFTLYTIGDGLCAQVPSLLVALAAGIVVTRVSDGSATSLGSDIIAQLSHDPQALGLAGLVLGAFGLMPGFPLLPFFLVGTSLLIASLVLNKAREQERRAACPDGTAPKVYSTVLVRMGESCLKMVSGNVQHGGQASGVAAQMGFAAAISKLRSDFFREWGILVPHIEFELLEVGGPHSHIGGNVPFRKLRDGGSEQRDAESDRGCVQLYIHNNMVATANVMASLESSELPVLHPRAVHPRAIVASALDTSANQSRMTTGEIVQERVLEVFRQWFHEFKGELIDDSVVRQLLDVYAAQHDDLINSIIPNSLSVTELTQLLRQLVIEAVPIREFATILQTITEERLAMERGLLNSLTGVISAFASNSACSSRVRVGGGELYAQLHAHNRLFNILIGVRLALRRTIVRSVVGANGEVRCHLLSGHLDSMLTESFLGGLPLSPLVIAEIQTTVDVLLAQQSNYALMSDDSDGVATLSGERPFVVVCSKYARLPLVFILKKYLSQVRVVAVEELGEDVPLNVIGEIEASDGALKDGRVLAQMFNSFNQEGEICGTA